MRPLDDGVITSARVEEWNMRRGRKRRLVGSHACHEDRTDGTKRAGDDAVEWCLADVMWEGLILQHSRLMGRGSSRLMILPWKKEGRVFAHLHPQFFPST